MKNILILIVTAAVFLHFYPQPEVTKFYYDSKETLLDKFSEFSDTNVRLKADKILIDLQPELNSFSVEEVTSLKEITSARSNVNEFYQDYCKNTKRSPVFHPDNQAKVCKTISKYESML
jgi:hypothetical protein